VVDDNQDSAETVALLLELWGHEVRVVHDGPSALEAAPLFLPEVILLDIGLPGLDGYEVARRLRRDPRLGQALLIAMTGYGQDRDRRLSQEAGFAHHLVKPVDPVALQELVAQAGAAD
jgi:two-component system CheB/CheR fusion protein